MSLMRIELTQMQENINKYLATQASLVATVQTMQDDTKEIRETMFMIMELLKQLQPTLTNMPMNQLTNSSAQQRDINNMQLVPATPSHPHHYRPGESRLSQGRPTT